jgi:hypothetical protein
LGYYINPPDMSKEEFLEKYGTPLSYAQFPDDPKQALVCIVDNGPFRAAAIAFSRREMEMFDNPNDDRPRRWYFVPKEHLWGVSDIKPENFEGGG